MEPAVATDSIEIIKLSDDNLFTGSYFEGVLQIVNDNKINGKKTVLVVEAAEKTSGLLTPEILKTLPHLTLQSNSLSTSLSQSLHQFFSNQNIKSAISITSVEENLKENTVVIVHREKSDECVSLSASLPNSSLTFLIPTPGIFTCDPKQFPSNSVLVTHFYFPEIEELIRLSATTFVDQQTISLLKQHKKSLKLKWAKEPLRVVTLIESQPLETRYSQAKVVVTVPVYVVQLETSNVQNVLSQVDFQVESVTCSSSEVTITTRSPPSLSGLQKSFNVTVKEERQVSVVGLQVSSTLMYFASSLKLIENSNVIVSSTAASVNYVLETSLSAAFAEKLSKVVMETTELNAKDFGPSYNEIHGNVPKKSTVVVERKFWWKERRHDLLNLAKSQTPLYVYDVPSLRESARAMKAMSAVSRVFFAIKANPNKEILQIFYEENIGFECVSPGELDHVLGLFPEIDRKRILFTPNFAPKEEYELGFKAGVNVTIDNIYPLLHWGDVFKNQEIFVRVDPGKGEGHHAHVKTAGKASKFGIPYSDISSLIEISKKTNTKIVGLHAHLGSGILTPESWFETANTLSNLFKYFPEIKYLDLGGGLGVPYKEDQNELDLVEVNKLLLRFKENNVHSSVELWMEPGRYLVAQSGVLLAKVTQTKDKEGSVYVGINAGFNSLLRPTLYGSYHQIANLSNLDSSNNITADVVGFICESGDVLGKERKLPATQENDVLLIATTGAYGRSMSSNYNLRAPATEVMLQ